MLLMCTFFASGRLDLSHPIIKGLTQDICSQGARKEVMDNEMRGLDPVVNCIGSRWRGQLARDNETLRRMISSWEWNCAIGHGN